MDTPRVFSPAAETSRVRIFEHQNCLRRQPESTTTSGGQADVGIKHPVGTDLSPPGYRRPCFHSPPFRLKSQRGWVELRRTNLWMSRDPSPPANRSQHHNACLLYQNHRTCRHIILPKRGQSESGGGDDILPTYAPTH